MSKLFEVTSGIIVCSDPAYSMPIWCQGVAENVKNGKWQAGIETTDEDLFGQRISKLWVYHLDEAILNPNIIKDIESNKGKILPFMCGVDSGQFGFFDYPHYRNDESAIDLPKYNFHAEFDQDSGDSWYRAMCDITLGKDMWGVVPFGVVSSSGYGDGSYRVTGIKNDDGEYVALYVIFIYEADDEDDCDDDDEVDEDTDKVE